jgi:hypothetical protein
VGFSATLDMREALGSELLDGGEQGVHFTFGAWSTV